MSFNFSDDSVYRREVKKKKKMGRLVTSYSLPRLDEMVLLQRISTPESKGNTREEFTRVDSVNSLLEKYNRWLAFVQSSKVRRDVRAAGIDLQQSIHELNAFTAEVMIQFDRKIADLEDRTEAFVDAIQEGEEWQTKGDLLNLTYDELDRILQKHPQRDTEDHLRHICSLVRRAADDHSVDLMFPPTYPPNRFLDKVMRLIREVQRFPNGDFEAFQLYLVAKASIPLIPNQRHFLPYDPFCGVGSDKDSERIDNHIRDLILSDGDDGSKSRRREPSLFYNFAAAKRALTRSWSPDRYCDSCHHPPTPPLPPPGGPQGFPPPPPLPPDPLGFPRVWCYRTPNLQLVEDLQKWAHGEIKAGIMLTLSGKLPKELCLLIFEYTMTAESLPLDPTVWEADKLAGMSVRGPLKAEYKCPAPPNIEVEP